MAVDTGMFKIDTCFTIGADDDLKLPYYDQYWHSLQIPLAGVKRTNLVIPSISASPHLDSPLKLITSTQKVCAELSHIFRFCIIQADDKKGRFNNFEARLVDFVGVDQIRSKAGPDFSGLSGQNTYRVFGNLVLKELDHKR